MSAEQALLASEGAHPMADVQALRTSEGRASAPALFDRVAPGYDRMNRLLSLGLDPSWRRRAVADLRAVLPSAGGVPVLLDVATGTADLALEAARQMPAATVVGLDSSPGMLALGRDKVAAVRLSSRIMFVEGDATALPFPSGSYDAVTCAFGVRNFPDVAGALAEFHRVLKPGGVLLVLEFFRPSSPVLGALTSAWLACAAPVCAPSRRADYAYLRRSIGRTLSVAEFVSRATVSGFSAPVGVSAVRFFFPCCSHVLLCRS